MGFPGAVLEPGDTELKVRSPQPEPPGRLRAGTRLTDSTDGFRDGLFLRIQDPRDQQSWSVLEILLRDETPVEGLL